MHGIVGAREQSAAGRCVEQQGFQVTGGHWHTGMGWRRVECSYVRGQRLFENSPPGQLEVGNARQEASI
jgi:hypothetical protein